LIIVLAVLKLTSILCWKRTRRWSHV